MPSRKAKRSAPPGTRPDEPIRRDEDITAREEELANDLPHQASYQESPLTDGSHRDTAREPRTARLADEDAGIESHRDQLANSERAFTQSRGSHAPRTKGKRNKQ